MPNWITILPYVKCINQVVTCKSLHYVKCVEVDKEIMVVLNELGTTN